MKHNELWQVFKDNGDPMCYLLMKAQAQSIAEPELPTNQAESTTTETTNSTTMGGQ